MSFTILQFFWAIIGNKSWRALKGTYLSNREVDVKGAELASD